MVKKGKSGRFKLNLDEELIKDMYVNKKLSSTEIALSFGCNSKTIQNRLKSFGIKLCNNRPPMSLKTRNKLSEAHKGKKLSPEHRLKAIKNLHGTFRKNKTYEEIYGKEKADEWKNKLSLAQLGEKNHWYGKKHSKTHNLKISEALKGKIPKNLKDNHKKMKGKGNPMYGRTGESNPQWNGGTSFEPYSKEFNEKFKRAIRKRDNQICMLCGIHREKLKIALIIHHIDYNKLLSIPQNCISLCNSCHSRTNSNRKHWINFFQSLLAEKYSYVYEENKIVLELKNDKL